MGAPASNGKLCTKVSDMLIGDYIKCDYVVSSSADNAVGVFKNIGNISTTEMRTIPILGAGQINNYFYFIKVDKGLLVADRRIQAYVSGKAYGDAGYITGKYISELGGSIRMLSYNEFLKYITNSNLNGNIIKQDVNVWNGEIGTISSILWGPSSPISEFCQDRINGNIKTQVFMDGTRDGNITAYHGGSTVYCSISGLVPMNSMLNIKSDGSAGEPSHLSFRPAFEYIDNTKSSNFWY